MFKLFVIILGTALVLSGCQSNLSDHKDSLIQSTESVSQQIEQPKKDSSELDDKEKSIQIPENVAKDIEQLEKDTDELEKKIESLKDAAQAQFNFYPSGPDFIKSIIDERGQVEITGEMRERFNLFARDYKFTYLPDMDYYESFFEANEYAQSFGYTNFGFAVFYVLQYMNSPEKMSASAMQNAIQSLFVAKESYKDMPQQAYRKLVNYNDGFYSPWPEGGTDQNRMFYLLTGLTVKQDGSNAVDITVRSKRYYFNDTNMYEAGENEKWLAKKSKQLGISDLQAAANFIASGEIEELKGDIEFETTIYIKTGGQNSYDYNPRFVSNRVVQSK